MIRAAAFLIVFTLCLLTPAFGEQQVVIAPAPVGLTVEQLRALLDERDRMYQAELKAIRDQTALQFNSLSTLVAALRTADKEAIALALTSAEKAVNKAEEASLRNDTKNNEFRGQLSDQAGTFVTRNEAYTFLAAFITLVFAAIQLLRKQGVAK